MRRRREGIRKEKRRRRSSGVAGGWSLAPSHAEVAQAGQLERVGRTMGKPGGLDCCLGRKGFAIICCPKASTFHSHNI